MYNMETYKQLVAEGETKALALIESNNGIMLKSLDPKELRIIDKELRASFPSNSLLETALLFGDLDAIKSLVEAGIEIPTNDASLKKYLSKLFCEYALVQSWYDEPVSYNKSVDNLINIFHYLKENVVKDNPVWTDKSTMNDLLATTAKGRLLTPFQALFELNLFDDINTTDTTGKTALYYLLNKKTDEQFIDKIKKCGAVLSVSDYMAIEQTNFGDNLTQAISLGNRQQIDGYLNEFAQDNQKITVGYFNVCLTEAIKRDDVNTVRSLLKSSHVEQLALRNLQYLIKSNSDEICYAIAETCQKKTSYRDNFEKSIKFYSHRIGCSGTIQGLYRNENRTYNLESNSTQNSREALVEALAGYATRNEKFKPIYAAISFMSNIDNLASSGDQAESMYYRYYSEGHSMILGVGWTGHDVGIGVKYDSKSEKTFISVSNRGGAGLSDCLLPNVKNTLIDIPSNGTIVYELNGKLDPTFFREMNRYNDKIFPDVKSFQNQLINQLKDAKALAVLPAVGQAHGTCSYVNQKRTVEGLLLIEAVCEGLPLDKSTLDDVYNQYKLFSVDDKQQAVLSLISFYKSYNQKPDADPIEIDALNKFVIAIILEHHSSKYNEIELESARKLYELLPNEQKVQLSAFIPKLSLVAHESRGRMTLFSEQRSQYDRDIKVKGDPQAIFQARELINTLLDWLRENKITGKEVRAIKVEKDKFTIVTACDTNVKYKLRDDIFKNKLGAIIENVSGKFEFIVKNPLELTDTTRNNQSFGF